MGVHREDSSETATGEQKRALITGAGGLLGRFITSELQTNGFKAVGCSHAELDITNQEHVKRSFSTANPELVINCAATTDVDRCEREPEWAFAVNEAGPRLLAQCCKEFGAELVHISTDYVFDGTKQGFYTQEDAPNPLSVYAESKLAGEVAVRDEISHCNVIRTSWLFGPGGKNFGSRVIELARSGARLSGVTDQISIPTYAADLSTRILEIVRTGSYGLFHATNSGPTTWYEFARLALELAGLSDVPIRAVTRADLRQLAKRPHNTALRCLASERLGLAPLRHWRDALEEFIRAK